MPTTRKASAVPRSTAIETGLIWPWVVPMTIDRTMRLRMSSTTAAPMIVWATGSRMSPRSSRTDAAIAVLVAVSVAPTKRAIVNCVPLSPTPSTAGTRMYAMTKPTRSGSTTPPDAHEHVLPRVDQPKIALEADQEQEEDRPEARKGRDQGGVKQDHSEVEPEDARSQDDAERDLAHNRGLMESLDREVAHRREDEEDRQLE